MNAVIIVLALLAIGVGTIVYLTKKSIIKDSDGDFIPDVVEEKVEEVKKRVERVKEEISDVVKIAKQFNLLRMPKNKVAGFEMQKYANIGISIEDLHKYTMEELREMYNIPDLNNKFMQQYKEKLGI
jgi:CRISPR/Cas system-associated protein Cas7 (RAMP superfamily)